MQHQYHSEKAVQVHHAPKETFPTNGNVRKVASSTYSIVSGQAEVAGTNLIDSQTTPSKQLQGNPICEPKVEKKGGKTCLRIKGTSTNASIVANQNKSEDMQRRQPGSSPIQKHYNFKTRKWGKIRCLERQKLVKDVEFIQKGFFLLFKNEDCEERLYERLGICPFSDSSEEKIKYTEKMEEETRENIKEEIHPEQAQRFIPTFIIPNLNRKRREIPDVSSQNKEIQTIHLKMNGSDQVRDLIRKGDRATNLDLKLAFHLLIEYPPHRQYLAFEAMWKIYQYRAMPFDHSTPQSSSHKHQQWFQRRYGESQTQEYQITQTICSSYIRTKKDCENKP
ncbi:MAG: hypothetical protein EZS28_002415 [Streblomastix strix]|uniref:Uncharacterized protein n=1 Tax=Streblomastix strix TaxID=222440 RepID=A0A5J4X4C9_9EUKA|nr:MAG: hypothetical protein EZS28_002415 [Streblomastix strix]